MTFKGRIINAGDKLYTAAGEVFTISDWSPGSGDIFGKDAAGEYLNIKRMPELFWNPPFMRRT